MRHAPGDRVPREANIVVVGAGIAGITTALELARRGVAVTVLDDGPVGGGETGRTSAHLTSAIDDGYARIERRHGQAIASLVAESHMAAIDEIEANVRDLQIDCDFARVDGYLFAGSRDGDAVLDREYEAAQRAGLHVERVQRVPLACAGGGLRFAGQGVIHPLRYVRGLAREVMALGGEIHTGVHATAIEGASRRGDPVTVRVGAQAIACAAAVDATNGALTSPMKLALEQAAYRSYVVGFAVATGAVPNALFWDTASPYHYVRLATMRDGRAVLLVGGGDHRTGQGDPAGAFSSLEAWTRRSIPEAGEVVARWSGQIIEPADGLAHIGPVPGMDGVFVVSGDSGEGLTYGAIAGVLLPELIRGNWPHWAPVYDPARSHRHGLGTLIKEAAHSVLPYADWLKRGDSPSTEAIPRGEGALVRRGLHLLACYRDEDGAVHERSATCPHLRGVVRWNSVEKTWDCPCHGSRFDAYGRVLNGPAPTDLAAVAPTELPPEDGVPRDELAISESRRITRPMAVPPIG